VSDVDPPSLLHVQQDEDQAPHAQSLVSDGRSIAGAFGESQFKGGSDIYSSQ